MAWLQVWIAALFEVGWVVGLKHADTVWAWIGTLIAIGVSFYLMIMAGKHLPAGTVYAVFVGLGTVGTVIAELLFFQEKADGMKLLLIGTLLIGIIGLKFVSDDQEQRTSEDST